MAPPISQQQHQQQKPPNNTGTSHHPSDGVTGASRNAVSNRANSVDVIALNEINSREKQQLNNNNTDGNDDGEVGGQFNDHLTPEKNEVKTIEKEPLSATIQDIASAVKNETVKHTSQFSIEV